MSGNPVARTFAHMTLDTSERQAIDYLLSLLKLPPRLRNQFYETAKRYDNRSVGAWRETFPDFPFLICVRSSEKLKELAGWHTLFGMKKGNKFLAELENWFEAAEFDADGRATAIMFKLPNVSDWAVVHNAGFREHGRSFAARVPLGGDRVAFLERMDEFVAGVMPVLKEYFEQCGG